MAKVVSIVDDITGEPDADRILFGLGDDAYSVDLTKEGQEELRVLLAPYMSKGVRLGKLQVAGGSPVRAESQRAKPLSAIKHTKEEMEGVRAWCAEHGIPLRDGGGRVSSDIWNGFEHDDVTLVSREHRGLPPRGQQQMLDQQAS